MLYQVRVLIDGVMRDTTWPPRTYRSAHAVARVMQRQYPQYSYWLTRID